MEGPDIVHVDESNFEFQVLAYSEKMPVLVDFWAHWATDSQRISPLLENLAGQNIGRFRLAKVNVDGNTQLTKRYQVHTVPAIKVFINGQITHQIDGSKTNLQLIEFVKKILPSHDKLLIEKAVSLLESKNYQEAEETCLEILQEDPNHPQANLLLAKSLIWQDNYPEALTILNRFPSSSEFPQAEKLIPLVNTLITGTDQQSSSRDPLDAVYHRAINLIELGNIQAALDGLLDILRKEKDFHKGLIKELVLGLFELLGDDHPVTQEYRKQLANILF
jgi:putative thioredoxin